MSQAYTNCDGLYQNLTIKQPKLSIYDSMILQIKKKYFKLMSFSCENILMPDDVTIISIY